jgi:isocitrate dehydrogenase (NAD+)
MLKGDGVGPEIVDAAATLIQHTGANINWIEAPFGYDTRNQHGTMLPEKVLDLFDQHKVIFKGPVTIPTGSNAAYTEIRGRKFTSPNQALRKLFGLYANVRPAKSFPGVKSRYDNVDLLVIRENTECCYTGEENVLDNGDRIELVRRITRSASKKICAFGFDLAEKQKKSLVTAVHKGNVMKRSDGLFLEEFSSAAKKSSLSHNTQLADSLLTALVLDPSKFDVLICPNLFGDLVSDLAGGLVGSLGLCPSGMYSDSHAIFEPAHGSAPDIAGQGIANPLSQILSGCMLLRHLGYYEQADNLESAVSRVLAEGISTTDLGGNAKTKEFVSAVKNQL